jgi:hypothetical protein
MQSVRCLLALGLFLAAAPRAHAQVTWGLAPLMQSLAEVKAASATFTETKTMALLKTPLQSSGTLHYVAPDYVRKTVLAPTLQDFVLQKDAVTLTAGEKTQHFDLSQAPPLAGLVEGVRATLAGDLPSLQHFYTIALSGDAETWQLLLRPRDASVSRFLSWLSIRGSGNRVTEIDTGGARGDLSRMSVDETIDHGP